MKTFIIERGDLTDEVVEYDDDTTFSVEIGKGPKGGYKDRLVFIGLGPAEIHYRATNIHSGYKKRFVMVSGDGTRQVLLWQCS